MKKSGLISIAFAVVAISVYHLIYQSGVISAHHEGPEVNKQNSKSMIADANSLPPTGGANRIPAGSVLTQFRNQELAVRFGALLFKHENLEAYFESLHFLGTGPDALVARAWIAMGLVIAPDSNEAVVMNLILQDVKENSEAVMAVLEEKQDELGEDSAFTEQLALPLVHHLNISPERKIKYFGNVIDNPMEFTREGAVTAKTANITNALIYMRETNAPYEVVEPLLREALQASKSDPKSHQELLLRVTAYFPKFIEN